MRISRTLLGLVAGGAAAATATAGLALPTASTAATATTAARHAPVQAFALAGERLAAFRTDRPGEARAVGRFTGLRLDQRIVSIDVRPSSGALYALGDAGGVYVVDPRSAALDLTARVTVPLQGRATIDFNPTVDLLRIVTTTGQNIRQDVDSMLLGTTVDGDLTYGEGAATGIAGVAYTGNDADAATGTQLYDVDTANDRLAQQVPANDGTLSVIGPLGRKVPQGVGLDVASRLDRSGRTVANTAYLTVPGGKGTPSRLFTVELTAGDATAASRFPRGLRITDVAVRTRG